MGSVLANQPSGAEHDCHLPIEPGDIQLVYADDRNHRHATALEDAAAIDFGRVRAVRKPPAYRRQRNFPGWWWSATTRSHVIYESWLQRHHIIEADRDVRVTGITGQPFELTWPAGKRQMRHVPDLFCRVLDGGGVVTDCRPVSRPGLEFEANPLHTRPVIRQGYHDRLGAQRHEGLGRL